MNPSKDLADQKQLPERENVTGQSTLFPRRKFLSSMVAGAGSLALAACGGGGDSVSSALESSAKVTAKAATVTASTDGTSIPPAASITDNSGGVWTVVNGVIYLNGALAGNTHSVTLLTFLSGSIY